MHACMVLIVSSNGCWYVLRGPHLFGNVALTSHVGCPSHHHLSGPISTWHLVLCLVKLVDCGEIRRQSFDKKS
jgi:hypothetical protein